MEYVYGALVLHAAGKPVNEENLKKVLTAAGVKVDETRVKALTAALEGVNIDEALKPVAFSRNVLYALIVSVAMWSATPVFIDVSTKSFFPSVHAAIFSRAPYDTITFGPSVSTSPNTSAAIFLRPSPSRILPVPLFSSYSRIRIGIPEPRSSHQRYASSTASGSDDVSMNGWTSQ